MEEAEGATSKTTDTTTMRRRSPTGPTGQGVTGQDTYPPPPPPPTSAPDPPTIQRSRNNGERPKSPPPRKPPAESPSTSRGLFLDSPEKPAIQKPIVIRPPIPPRNIRL